MIPRQVGVNTEQKKTAGAQQHTLLRLRTGVHAGKGWCDDCMNSCVRNNGCDGRQNWLEKLDCYNNCKSDYCLTFCPS